MKQRRLFIDWMRGLAVLCMIEHHSFDAWLKPELHGSAYDRLFRFLGGVAAPSFLFLAGLAIVLMLEGQLAKGVGRSAAAWGAAKRGGLIFLGAYLFRFQEWALAFGAAPATDLLRIDVLNAIGIGLILVSLLWGALPSLPARAVGFAVAAGLVAALAPVVWSASLSGVPQIVSDYLRGKPPRALFPLFPWTAHAFAGALVGLGFARVRRAANPVKAEAQYVLGWLAGGSIVLWFATRFLDGLPGQLYSQLDWWQTSPAYFLLRTCSSIWILAGCWAVERAFAPFWSRLPAGPLVTLGRHSLIIYWVHVELVYGRWFWRSRGHLDLQTAALCFLAVLLSQIALAYSIVPVSGWLKFRLAKQRTAPQKAPQLSLGA